MPVKFMCCSQLARAVLLLLSATDTMSYVVAQDVKPVSAAVSQASQPPSAHPIPNVASGVVLDPEAVSLARIQTWEPIDLSGFRDSIHHWQMKEGRDRADERLRPNQIVHIAENILRFQNDDGGWPTNLDWLTVISDEEVREIRRSRAGRSTFDNRNVYPQIEYLAQVARSTGLQHYQHSAVRALNYILREQRASGGWCGKDVDAITYNDDVMTGIMNLLLDVRQDAPQFDFLSQTQRTELMHSLLRAIDVTLRCQIVIAGEKTAWCQQHDHITLQPIKARTYELPSITAQESAGIVRFLMQLEDPPENVVQAVESAVKWFESSCINGLRIETVSIDPVRFKNFTATTDRRAIADPEAPSLWARFYELDSGRPFFCNRDGIKVYQLSEVQLERRVGYGWYGRWPARLLDRDYAKWKSALSIGRQ